MHVKKKTKERKTRGKRTGGLRTAAGKVRASMNALTHGLSARVGPDPLFVQQSRKLALALCGGQDNGPLFDRALKVAECDHAYRRVQAHRLVVIERLWDPFAIPFSKDNFKTLKRVLGILDTQIDLATRDHLRLFTKVEGKTYSPLYIDKTNLRKRSKYEPLPHRNEFQMMKAASRDLARIERYERRAWSRRNRAIRGFIATIARMDSEPPINSETSIA